MNGTRFCIIRHGETEWNVERRIQGQIDQPLNRIGLAQAEATGRGLLPHVFSAAYSSDLVRALATANAVVRAMHLTVQMEPGLRERHYGVLQGLTAAEIEERFPDLYPRYRGRDPHEEFNCGESLQALSGRVSAALESLAARHPGETVLLITHGGVLDICYRKATGRNLSATRDFPIPNAALNWLEVAGDNWRVLEWANRRHLEQTLEESAE